MSNCVSQGYATIKTGFTNRLISSTELLFISNVLKPRSFLGEKIKEKETNKQLKDVSVNSVHLYKDHSCVLSTLV